MRTGPSSRASKITAEEVVLFWASAEAFLSAAARPGLPYTVTVYGACCAAAGAANKMMLQSAAPRHAPPTSDGLCIS